MPGVIPRSDRIFAESVTESPSTETLSAHNLRQAMAFNALRRHLDSEDLLGRVYACDIRSVIHRSLASAPIRTDSNSGDAPGPFIGFGRLEKAVLGCRGALIHRTVSRRGAAYTR